MRTVDNAGGDEMFAARECKWSGRALRLCSEWRRCELFVSPRAVSSDQCELAKIRIDCVGKVGSLRPISIPARTAGETAAKERETGTSARWTILERPVLETLLRSYARHPTVAQPMILHGPRGVGKRTVIQGQLKKWNRAPHFSAYVDFYPKPVIPSWTMSGMHGEYQEEDFHAALSQATAVKDLPTLGTVRTQLEQGLELLTWRAVEMSYINSEIVRDILLENHSVGGALLQFLRANGERPKQCDINTAQNIKDMWSASMQLLRKTGRDTSGDYLGAVHLNKTEQSQLGPHHRNPGSPPKSKSHENTFLTLLLVKKLLKIQEDWRGPSELYRKRYEIASRTLADSATSWAILLLRLLSFAVKENQFQPKLVINNVDLMRKAFGAISEGSVNGSSYHDSLLMNITKIGTSIGCIPIIFITSDSYYSCKVFADHGDDLAFISQEVLGWTPKEAEIHLVPTVFENSEWKLITGVLGSTVRHLAELHSIWHNPSFMEVLEETTENAMGDCVDLYLGYLQVTAVDPAMEATIKILEKFGEDVIAGTISKKVLRHGVAWRYPPHNPGKRRRWAKIQLLDYLDALAAAGFAVNHRDVRAQELLEDPSTNALLEVGILYQQKELPYIRPTSRGVSRCLVRWHVRERLNWSFGETLSYAWHRLIRGRFYKQLLVV